MLDRWRIAPSISPPLLFLVPAQSLIIPSLNFPQNKNGRTSDLIFPIPRLIAIISAGITIQPGDIIATGTPAGILISMKIKNKIRIQLVMCFFRGGFWIPSTQTFTSWAGGHNRNRRNRKVRKHSDLILKIVELPAKASFC